MKVFFRHAPIQSIKKIHIYLPTNLTGNNIKTLDSQKIYVFFSGRTTKVGDRRKIPFCFKENIEEKKENKT